MTSRFQLLSLWDLMRKFEVEHLYEVVGTINLATGHLVSNSDKPLGTLRPMILSALKGMRPRIEALRLQFTLMKLDRAIAVVESKSSEDVRDIVALLDDLHERLTDEVRQFHFLEVAAEKAQFYSPSEPLFGDLVELSFPSASPEVLEAGKCFALGRNSAAVYHLMRTLEVGLTCLATAHGVPFANANWQTILDQIDKAVGAMNKTSHGPDWKSQQQFYAEACVHFRMLKNAWRNYAMHLHERYDEERALEIWNTVRAFMRHLAKDLHEGS